MDGNLLWLSANLSASADTNGVIAVTGSSIDASNTPITSSFFVGDGRYLTNITASYITSSRVDGPFGMNSILSASYAATASFVVGAGTAQDAISASYAATASIADTASYALTASYFSGSVSNSISASYADTASIAATASFVTASNVYGPFGSNSILSASYALTASFYRKSVSYYAVSTIVPIGVINFSLTSSGNADYQFINANVTSGGAGPTGSLPLPSNNTGREILIKNVNSVNPLNIVVDGGGYLRPLGLPLATPTSVTIGANQAYRFIAGKQQGAPSDRWYFESIDSASYAATASIATSASYAATASIATSASYALSASYAPGSGTSENAISASYAATASLADTASYALTASYIPDAYIQGGNSFGSTAYLGTNDNNSLIIETSGSSRMIITNSGSIGVGTLTPSASFQVSGSVLLNSQNAVFFQNFPSTNNFDPTIPVQLAGGAGNNAVGVRADRLCFYPWGSGTTASMHFGSAGYLAWVVRNLSTSSFQIVSTPAGPLGLGSAIPVLHLSSGSQYRVGILTTNPQHTLDVSGSARITSSVYLPGLTTTSQNNIVIIDTASGQLYYTASNAIGGGGNFVPSAWTGSNTSQFAGTASYALTALTASYFSGSISNAIYAQTASYISSSNVDGPFGMDSIKSASYAATSSIATSASYALSASFAVNSTSASYARTASIATSASYAATASIATSASYAATASTAISASYARTASIATSSSYALSASHALTAATSDFAINATTATSATTAATATNATSASYADTASYFSGSITNAINAITASYILSSGVDGPFGMNSVLSASHAVTAVSANTAISAVTATSATSAATATNATSASYAGTASIATSSSYTLSASFATNSISASYAATASFVVSASYARTASIATSSSYAATASFVVSASYAATVSFVVSASYAATASFVVSASYVRTASIATSASYALTSSIATSASYAATASTAVSASYAATASIAISASYARTASIATSASYAATSSFTISASYADTASNAVTASYIDSANVYGPNGFNSIDYADNALLATTSDTTTTLTINDINDGATYYPVFVDGTTNDVFPYVNSAGGFTYTPDTNTTYTTASWALNVSGGVAAAIDILDQGISLTPNVSSINFVGNGVTAANVGDAVTVTIDGGGAPGGDNTQIQFNSGSTLSGSSNFTFDYTNNNLTLTGSMFVSGAISASSGPNTIGFHGTSSWAINAITSSYPIRVTGSGTSGTLYSIAPRVGVPAGSSVQNNIWLGFNAGLNTSANVSVFLGNQAGYNADSASFSAFIGSNAGNGAKYAERSTFIGAAAGQNAISASDSSFLGNNAGYGVTFASQSTMIGLNAGQDATNANDSSFLGSNAGRDAKFANNSTIIGSSAGYGAVSASYSTLLGYQAGYASPTTNTIKSNNIIIGTNITLPANSQNSINLGGIIFATGSYSTLAGNPSSSPAGGKVGINVYPPLYNLHVSGTVALPTLETSSAVTNVLTYNTSTGQVFYTASNAIGGGGGGNTFPFTGNAVISGSLLVSGSGITVTGSLNAPSITGSLLGTASYVTGSIFTSTNPALSASYAATSSYVKNSYATNFGDGVNTEYAINHGLNTADVHVTVYRNTLPYDTILCDVERTVANAGSINWITLRFATPPAGNAYRVVVTKAMI